MARMQNEEQVVAQQYFNREYRTIMDHQTHRNVMLLLKHKQQEQT